MTSFTETYIVAGGPSLFNFDWSKLEGKTVIAVNRAYEKVPHAAVCYFGDRRFWHWHSKGLLAHAGRKICGTHQVEHAAVERYKFAQISGLCTKPEHLAHGNNSGYAAINLAYHLGAKHIYLLGYDMKFDRHRCHWHEPYEIKNREELFAKMLPYFQTLVEPLAAAGVEVWNANMDSEIRCFPKCSLEDLFLGEEGTLAAAPRSGQRPLFLPRNAVLN